MNNSNHYYKLLLINICFSIFCIVFLLALFIDLSGDDGQKNKTEIFDLSKGIPVIRTDESESDYSKELPLYALSAALIDGDSGRILYEKDGFTARPNASTTKIMTLIVALENADSNEIVKVSPYAAKMPDVQLGLLEDEKYRLGDLYYSLMLESHNDTAVAVAEQVGGSVSGFAALMNEKAKKLQLSNTYFITPNGLDASDINGTHSVSAVDLAQIMRYCVMISPKREEFIKITSTRETSFSTLAGNRIFYVYNRNKYLDMNKDAISGKTGFTCDAGYCYVGAVKNDNRTFMVALLGCGWPNNKNYKWKDMETLVSYAKQNYFYQNIISDDFDTGKINVKDGIDKDGHNVYSIDTYTDANLNLLVSASEDIKLKKTIYSDISAPVKRGEVIGRISVYLNDYEYTAFNIYSKDNIYRKDFMYWLNYTFDRYIF